MRTLDGEGRLVPREAVVQGCSQMHGKDRQLRRKIAELRELGFADPVEIITSTPPILRLASENLRRKIADLRDLSFTDPVKMITSLPRSSG